MGFLIILKYVLLILLAVIITVLLYVLFTPFAYHADIDLSDENKTFSFRLKDALRLADVKAGYDKKFTWSVRLLFGFIRFPKEKTEKEAKKSDSSKVSDASDTTASRSEHKSDTVDKDSGHKDTEDKNTEEKDKNKVSIFKKIKIIIGEIENPYNQEAVSYILKLLGKLLNNMAPDVSMLDMTYSFGSPDITGIAYGVFAMIPMLYGKGHRLDPDFDSDDLYFTGKAVLSGKILVIWVAALIIKALMSKYVRHMIKRIKRAVKYIKG